MQETLKQLGAFIEQKDDSKVQNSSTAENDGSHDAAVSETAGEPPSKRAKLEPSESAADSQAGQKSELCVCVVCLGVLQGLCGAEQAAKVCVCVCVHHVVISETNVKLTDWSCFWSHRLQRQ